MNYDAINHWYVQLITREDITQEMREFVDVLYLAEETDELALLATGVA